MPNTVNIEEFNIEDEISKLPDRQVWLRQQLAAKTITQRNAVEFAAREAESVLHIWEKEFPDDRRPHDAIASAWAWRSRPTKLNKKAARIAAVGAANAANSSIIINDNSIAAFAAFSAAYAAYAASACCKARAASEASDSANCASFVVSGGTVGINLPAKVK